MKILNIRDSVNMRNYRVYNDRITYAGFAKQSDGSWLTGLGAKASHDVELRFDGTAILWALETT